MQEQMAFADVGEPIILRSEGRQHSPLMWAETTANEIWSTADLAGDKLASAERVKREMIGLMKEYFEDQMLFERLCLTQPTHCSTPLNPVKSAIDLMMDIQTIKTDEWYDQLKSAEWSDAALQVICSNLATVMHIERLWFADDHPENLSAQTYKLQAQGI